MLSSPPTWMDVLQRVLAIGSWTTILALIYVLWRVAYFYQRASGERLHHYLVVVPGVLLAAGAVWYIVRSCMFVGEPVGDALLFVGGILLALFAFRLQELMTGERR